MSGDAAAKRATTPTPRGRRAVEFILLASSVLAIVAAVTLAWVHVDDRYRVDHVGGARMALAQYANEGVLYPPIHDEAGDYGGTRFMPLPIVLHAGAATITGEYLVSGKLLAYATAAMLVLVLFLLLRRMRCPVPLAAGLATMVLVTQTGLGAAMGLRADALPVVLQVLAVWLMTESRRPHATIGAALLAALAFAAKLSAVWAPMAIGLWLLGRDRRRLVEFSAAYLVGVLVFVGIFAMASDGRLLANILGLGGAGLGDGRLLTAPYRLFLFAVDDATPAWFLLPAVALAAWYALRDHRNDVWLVAIASSLTILVVVLTDIGTGWNQLIDLVVLVAIAVGALVGRTLSERSEGRVVATALLVAVTWVHVTALATDVLPDVRNAAHVVSAGTVPGLDPHPLRGIATSETSLLSEDAYLPVSLGQRPVVLDAFMLRRLDRSEPEAVDPLVERIRAQEFDVVVLLLRVDEEDTASWWQDFHFGPRIADALRDAYAYRETRGPYEIYEPAAEHQAAAGHSAAGSRRGPRATAP